MPKTKAQKAARKARRQALAKPAGSKARKVLAALVATNAIVPRTTARSRRAGKRSRNQKSNNGIPGTMSAVNDGVNTGMVWKNSNHVRDFFATRFEKVTDLIAASTAFAIIKQFYLNPGNSLLFPVFSQIASTYEEYICHRCRFWFRGIEYTASGSNVSAGVIVYSTNMDPDDSSFGGVDQMENYEGSTSGPPFTGHFVHDVGVVHKSRGRNRTKGDALSLNTYFVYSSANQIAPQTQQGKFYDMGNTQIAVNGCQAATTGELWVEHSWTMIRRKQQTPIGQNLLAAVYTSSTGLDVTHQMGTSQTQVSNSNITLTFSASLTFSIPVVGRFLVAYTASGTALAATQNFLASTNATLVRQGTCGQNTAATSLLAWAVFDITVVGGLISFPTFTATTFTAAVVEVSQVPGALTVTKPHLEADACLEAKLADLTDRFDKMSRLLERATSFDLNSPDDFKEVMVNDQGRAILRPPGIGVSSSPFVTKRF